MNPMSIRREYNDLLGQRAQHLSAAEAALASGDRTGYQAALDRAKAMDTQLEDLGALLEEQDRYAKAHAPRMNPADQRDLEEMGRMLAAHKTVRIGIRDLMAYTGMRQHNSTTVATGTIVAPVGAGSDIRDGFAGQVSGLIDQVRAVNLEGMTSYEEPYVVSDMAAQGAKTTTAAGTARTASDPTFAKAVIKPYECSVTSYVDRNLSRINPADYAAKIQSMALRALRRKINELIVKGDGQSTMDMYGITNAKNAAGTAIYATAALGTAISADTLDQLVFGYGGDEEVGGAARLLLTKANLKAIGALRGTNEKRRLYKITPDVGNPNTGVIEDGGLIIPYTIVSKLGDTTLAYGDPSNYELGLFGDYVIRVDESVKAIERMHTVLGDVMVGGNLVVDKGFVVGTLTEE